MGCLVTSGHGSIQQGSAGENGAQRDCQHIPCHGPHRPVQPPVNVRVQSPIPGGTLLSTCSFQPMPFVLAQQSFTLTSLQEDSDMRAWADLTTEVLMLCSGTLRCEDQLPRCQMWPCPKMYISDKFDARSDACMSACGDHECSMCCVQLAAIPFLWEAFALSPQGGDPLYFLYTVAAAPEAKPAHGALQKQKPTPSRGKASPQKGERSAAQRQSSLEVQAFSDICVHCHHTLGHSSVNFLQRLMNSSE